MLTFTWGRQINRRHVLNAMWTISLTCAEVAGFVRTFPVVVHSARCLGCLRSLMTDVSTTCAVVIFVSIQTNVFVIHEHFFESEDGYRAGCWNVIHSQQQSYSGLHSPGQSCATLYLWNDSCVRTFYSVYNISVGQRFSLLSLGWLWLGFLSFEDDT